MSSDGDSAIPLSRMRARLARPRGTRQIDAMLQADNPAAAVAELSALEIYQLVKEVGFADAHDLIALASPEQVRGCLDLDAWDRDQVQIAAMEPWLSAVLDAGFEKLGQVWQTLDPELAALLLARQTYIYDLSLGEEVPDDEERPLYFTPDSFFAIAATTDDDEAASLINRLLEDLYRADMVQARHTIMAARSEPLAELEEMSYRWRSGRLADLGYADYYEALEVFRPLDTTSVSVGEGTEDHLGHAAPGDEAGTPRALPMPLAEQVVGKIFLARALGQLGDASEEERIEAAFLVLTNKVLSALRISPGDDDGLRWGADYALGATALGLEIVSHGDLDRAADALRTVSLTRLHRVGYTATLKLARFARAIRARAGAAGTDTAALVEALTSQRPSFPCELDDPPGSGPRAFESQRDVRRAAEALTRLALRIAVAEAMGANVQAAAAQPGVGLDDYIRTALVRAMIGGEPTPTPLSDAELTAVRARAFAGASLTEAAREAASTAVLAVLDRERVSAGRDFVPELVGAWLEELEELFGGLPAGELPDARFLAGVITEGGRD